MSQEFAGEPPSQELRIGRIARQWNLFRAGRLLGMGRGVRQVALDSGLEGCCEPPLAVG